MGGLDITEIKWNEAGLLPVILQDYLTGRVLMLGYMNKEALEKTIETKEAWFWSRSRKQLWHKGETSGNIQKVQEMALDCDRDTLLLKVKPLGPTCHLGTESCFGEKSALLFDQLTELIDKRFTERPEKSYTSYLFNKGLDKILKKVGEEASEVIIAAKNQDEKEMAQEMADLLYHLFVLLKNQNSNYRQIIKVLEERRG